MNTYTITAYAYFKNTYYVEAENEQDALDQICNEAVDPDESDLESLENLDVIDVVYGEVEMSASLTVSFIVRGVENDLGCAKDALWDILATFDGKTIQCGAAADGELELTGFNVESVSEV